MRRTPLIVAVVLALVGLVWIGQGTGLIGGSAMSGSSFWAVIGLVLLVVAGIVVAREARRTAP
jgi:glucose dehydrogenase